MKYQLYKELFELKKGALVVPSDCSPQEPEFLLSASINPRNWTVRWLLRFADDHYARIQEHYRAPTVRVQGGRIAFALHYGPITRVNDKKEIAYDAGDPVVIRMDTYPEPVHLHVGSREPHIGQERVQGLDLASVSCFDFLQRIFEHRRSGISIQTAFGFKIIEEP